MLQKYCFEYFFKKSRLMNFKTKYNIQVVSAFHAMIIKFIGKENNLNYRVAINYAINSRNNINK